ncbi:MAG: tetratricopeptide repeat protein [Acidobacteriota bacterium]
MTADDAPEQVIELLIDSGRLAEARAQLSGELPTSSPSPEVRYLEAKILFKERKFRESLEILDSLVPLRGWPNLAAVDSQPVEGVVRRLRMKSLFLAAKNFVLLDRLDVAEPLLLAARQIAPEDHLLHFHLGLLYFSTSRFAAAESAFTNVVKLHPSFYKAHELLGLSHEELGKFELALSSYRTAIELGNLQNQRDGSPYLRLAKLLLARNQNRESLPVLEEAAGRLSDCAEAFFLLGKVLNSLARAAEAENALQRSVTCDGHYADPHYLLSRIYLAQGRNAEAAQQARIFQQLKAREPTNVAKPLAWEP